jgi:hypothetical protein
VNHILRKIIAATQGIGALLAACFTSYELIYTVFHPVLLFLAGYLFAACALGIYAGVLLWRDRRPGYPLSIVAQAVQIPLVVSSTVSYALIFGFGVWIYYTRSGDGWDAGINFRLGELHQFYILGEGLPVSIGINLVALCFAVILWRAHRALPAK